MFFYYCSILAFAIVFFAMYRPKKSPWRLLEELAFEAHFQLAGAGGLLDDLLLKRRNKLKELPNWKDRIAVVTGGARGIGKEVVKKLLECEMTVIIGVRNVESGKKMVQQLAKGQNVVILQLDVSSLRSVKTFAEKVISEYPSIQLLVNNAGIMFGDYKVTEDNFESQLATNYLGHFYLAHLLIPSLRRGAAQSDSVARIVNVSSCAHFPGKVYFDDMNLKERYTPTIAYAQSKLAQLMYSRYLNERLAENDDRILVFSVHPGIVNTDLFDDTNFRKYFSVLMDIFFKTPEKGAVSILYAGLSPEVESKGGLYISNCGEGISNSFSKNRSHQEKLFKLSCEMVGLTADQYGGNKS